jgi:Ca2+-binding RTX toxin-like protein
VAPKKSCTVSQGGIVTTLAPPNNCPIHEPDITSITVDLGDRNDTLYEDVSVGQGYPPGTGPTPFEITLNLGSGNDGVKYLGGDGRFGMTERVFGGDGNDTIEPSQRQARPAALVSGGSGNDSIKGMDFFYAGDRLFGGPGRDILKGKKGADLLNGGGANDVCNGGTNKGGEFKGPPEADRAPRCEKRSQIP